MPLTKHVHKYRRVDIGRKKPYIVMKCALPECTHYVQEALALDRESRCWYCDKVFSLNTRVIALAKPHCGCQFGIKSDTRDVEAFIESEVGDLFSDS